MLTASEINLSDNTTDCMVFDPVTDEDVPIENISSIITIVIATIGIIFNVLNVVIASRLPSKGSLHIYLVALSIVDFLYLVCVLPSRTFRCGDACPPPLLSAKIYEKYIYLPFGNMFAAMDTFLTMSWGIHRLTYIHSPRIIKSTSSVPLKAVILSTVVSVAMHLPYFFKWRLQDGRLYRTQFSQSKMDLDYGIVLMVLTKALPIATLCVANVMLIVAVNKSIKRRVLTLNQPRQAKDSHRQVRLNILLIAIICLMVVGNTPVVLSYPAFSEKLFNLKDECLLQSHGYRQFRAVANLIAQLNYASNFLIYFAINKPFKKKAHSLWRQVLEKLSCGCDEASVS